MTRSDRSVRAYRRLLALYPKQFRDEYREDMVFVFEEMLADLPASRVWLRTVRDAASSIITQRLETVMSKKSMLRPLGFAGLALATLVAVSARGVNNLAVFVGTVAVTVLLLLAALVYWHAYRSYVEPSDDVHRSWLRFVLAGAGCIALVNVGTAADLHAPWLLLFSTVIVGIVFLVTGVVLGLWNGFARLRRAGDNGVWPAS